MKVKNEGDYQTTSRLVQDKVSTGFCTKLKAPFYFPDINSFDNYIVRQISLLSDTMSLANLLQCKDEVRMLRGDLCVTFELNVSRE